MNEKIKNYSNLTGITALLFLSLLFITLYLASAVLAYRMLGISILGIIPAPPLIFPLTYAILDMVAELYGKEITYRLLFITLFFEILFGIIVYNLATAPAPLNWEFQQSYQDVFGGILRFISAGFFATLVGSLANIYFFSQSRIFFKNKHFLIRSIASSLIGGLVLVIITVVLGYENVASTDYERIALVLNIYMIEFIYAIVFALPSWFIVNLINVRIDRSINNKKITRGDITFDEINCERNY